MTMARKMRDSDETVEVSHGQASKIIDYFREKWGPYGQPLDP